MCLKTFYCSSKRTFPKWMLLIQWELTFRTTCAYKMNPAAHHVACPARCASICVSSFFPNILSPYGNRSAESSFEAWEPLFAILFKSPFPLQRDRSAWMEPCEDQDIPKNWAFQSILRILRTQEHIPCVPKDFLARTESKKWDEAQQRLMHSANTDASCIFIIPAL